MGFYKFQFKHEKGAPVTDLDILRWAVTRSLGSVTKEQTEVIAEILLHEEKDILMFNNLFDIYVKILNVYYTKGFHKESRA